MGGIRAKCRMRHAAGEESNPKAVNGGAPTPAPHSRRGMEGDGICEGVRLKISCEGICVDVLRERSSVRLKPRARTLYKTGAICARHDEPTDEEWR